jgi:hypothetical protein
MSNDFFPAAPSASHTAGSFTASDVAIDRPSYVVSLRLRNP